LASGQPITQAQRVQLTPQVRAQLNTAPIVPHPLVTPATAIVAPKAPARAIPPVQARPVVETRQGFERAGSPGTPVRAPQPPTAANRPAGQPQLTATQPLNRAGFPQQRQPQVIGPAPNQVAHPSTLTQTTHPTEVAPAPITRSTPTAQVPANNRPSSELPPARVAATPQPTIERQAPAPQPISPRSTQQPETAHANAPQPEAAHAQPMAPQFRRPAPRPPDQPRPLINKTPPVPVQPPFAQQKPAIQSTDPGRPLGPHQVENLRNGRPAGPAQQPEPAHPLPTPRPSSTEPPNKSQPRQPNEKETQQHRS
jgi:hypothetical protein